jgi:hypothetical protein
MSRYVFSVEGDKTFVNGQHIICKGLRCSSGAYSDESTAELIENLPVYRDHGVNCISAFFMGNRFTDMKGYTENGSLDPVIAERMGRIIEAADELGIVVLVGCLYWGESKGKYESWTQNEASTAIANTVKWLAENDYRNTFVDVDNEGMGIRFGGFDDRELVLVAKKADPSLYVATNFVGTPPDEVDLAIHHSDRAPGKPYIESEGTPENAPGAYWGAWSRQHDPTNRHRRDPNVWHYLRVGQYAPGMKENEIELAKMHYDRGDGYLFASTWLQEPAPNGPNHNLGGDGSEKDPGMRWWLEWLKDTYGAYVPPVAK